MSRLLLWMFVSSVLAFIWCGFDKRAARLGLRRIPERCFFLLGLCGGGPGLWVGMKLFRHKTRHPLFWIVATTGTLLWALVIFFFARMPDGLHFLVL